jgi:hypothetical protein
VNLQRDGLTMRFYNSKTGVVLAGVLALSLFGNSATATAQDTACLKATLVDGDDCQKAKVVFDGASCVPAISEKSVKATCWNGKRVGRLKTETQQTVATFGLQEGWGGKNWTLLSVVPTALTSNVPANPSPANPVAQVASSQSSQPASVEEAQTQVERTPASTVPLNQAPAPALPPADSAEALKISGLADLYYSYNFNRPAVPTTPTSTATAGLPAGNNLYRFNDIYHDNTTVGLLMLALRKTQGPVQMKVDLAYGPVAELFTPNDEVSKHFNQAVITYTLPQEPRLTFSAGKMLTHIGVEGLYSKDNWHYSRPIMWNYGMPFWHNGFSSTFNWIPGRLAISGYLYDNYSGSYQTNRQHHTGFQINTVPFEGFALTYNFIGGSEPTTSTNTGVTKGVGNLHELNGTWTINESFAVQFDAISGVDTRVKADNSTGNWNGYTIAAKYSVGAFYVSPRYEEFRDEDALKISGGPSQMLSSRTLTTSYTFEGGLETRLEYRQDSSNKKPFTDGDGVAQDTQSTVTFATMLSF